MSMPVGTPAILVLGMPGAGKSRFISHLVAESPEIGQRCTKEVKPYKCMEKDMCLIDTPDLQTIRDIARFLFELHEKQTHYLIGCIYVHDMNTKRFEDPETMAKARFETLWGDENAQSALYVTTRWTNDIAKKDRREFFLQDRPEYFGRMLSKGARMVQCGDNRKAALSAITILEEKGHQVYPAFLKEFCNEKVLHYLRGQIVNGKHRPPVKIYRYGAHLWAEEVKNVKASPEKKLCLLKGQNEKKIKNDGELGDEDVRKQADFENRLSATEAYMGILEQKVKDEGNTPDISSEEASSVPVKEEL